MKGKFAVLHHLSQWHRAGTFLLAVCWFVGVLLGFYAAVSAGDLLVSMMCGCVGSSVSIVHLMAACLFPFLISALAVYISEPWLVLIVCTLKAFGFSFCAFGVSLTFGSAGWLVRFLLLFSDCLTIPALYFFWIILLKKQGRVRLYWAWGLVIYAAVVGITDCCLIAPFLQTVILR